MITLGAYCHHVHCRRNKQTCTRRELSFKSLTFPHAKASSIVLMNPNWTICQDFTRIINVLFLKIYLAINGKMLKGYKELIQENITIIPLSTNMSNIRSPLATTLAKELKASPFFHISLKCCCLWSTSSATFTIV